MAKHRVKQFLWLILAVVAALTLWLALSRLAALITYFQQGADPSTALNIVPNVPLDLHVDLDWLADDADTGRQIEPFTRSQIEAAYLRAWLQWNISYLRNEPYGLGTYFAGPALDAVSQAVTDAAAKNLRIAQVDSVHQLKLRLYSADGSIVSFTDTRALVAQTIRDSSGQIIFAGETEASYDVVMFLEDGNWRVRHWLRTDAVALDELTRDSRPAQPQGFVTSSGNGLTLNGQPFRSAGINYYPQATPWDEFWPNYDPAIIDRDFAILQSLGLNTIRIFVPYEQFGGPRVEPTRMEQLANLLSRADAHGLKVIVTLFDFRADYSLLLWPNADRHLEQLLTRFKDNRTILAWDIKNEPDRDYAIWGRETVNSWLAHTARLARRFDANHLITIGWTTPDAAHALPNIVDVVSFHYYAPADQFVDEYQALRAALPADKPILLSEFGLPTWNSFLFPNGHSRPEQAVYYADVLEAFRTTDAVGYLAWTMYDFEHVPPSVAGRYPWQLGPQKHLGVLLQNGTPKPAAALLTPNASLDVTRIPAWARFLKPFWITIAAVITGVLFISSRVYKRRVGTRGKHTT